VYTLIGSQEMFIKWLINLDENRKILVVNFDVFFFLQKRDNFKINILRKLREWFSVDHKN
jgi:hypothetical protein